jgi:hypothetical protein
MKEIITLQFGNYSNYVGSHYWNIQVKSKINKRMNFIHYTKIFQNLILILLIDTEKI